MPTDEPLVSVILPAYNAQATLAQVVQSVLMQDYSNLELLVIDDGSTDGTAVHPALKDPRIRVLQQQNAGPAAARYLGLEHARGDLITFIDADDLWMPGNHSRVSALFLAASSVGRPCRTAVFRCRCPARRRLRPMR